ncbi:MAG: DUF2007 domain-containing protein [Firmicutes bacterium]|nr:DUF2007 domain-containing protein [Bacillota bacterium]
MSKPAALVTVLEVQNPTTADLIKSILQGAGIECFIPGLNLGLIYGGALGLKIQVRPEDVEDAKTIIAQLDL